MIAACRDYLELQVRALNPTVILRNLAEFDQRIKSPPAAAVEIQDEKLSPLVRRVARWTDGNGQRWERRQRYQRILPFAVVLDTKSTEAANALFVSLVTSLAAAIDDGEGNAVQIEVAEASWNEAGTQVLFVVRFVGGIYQDRLIPTFDTVTIETQTG